MARSVSKSLASATVYVIAPNADGSFSFDDDGNIIQKSFNMSGNPSENKALIEAQKRYGKNVMVVKIDVDETKLTVSPDSFYLNSDVCIDGVSYGHDYITQTFKETWLHGFYMENGSMVAFENCYHGVTTDNKLRNFMIDACGTKNVVITSTEIKETRRYMTRAKYMSLAK